MEQNIILGVSLFFGWRFLHFLTVNCSCYPRESNSLHSEARFSLFFSFSAFFSRKMHQSPIFLLSLTFCQKNWNKEAPCNTEKPPLRMETYPVLFWFVFLKFLRIVLLHLESLMLIKKWNHNHSEQINIHSEWRQNFTKRMHQPACKMEKYRFWIGKSPCMLSFIFVQVWPKGMKHHLFRTNNFHSAWRFLRFIFEHIYRHFSLHHGNNQKSIQMLHFYIALLMTAAPLSCFFWNLQAQVFQLLGPGSCFLLASKSGFSHLKHVSP